MTQIKCPKCKETKTASEYNKGKKGILKLQTYCRACSRKYWFDNKDKLSIRDKAKSRTDSNRYSQLKRSSKSRGIITDISYDDYRVLIRRDCDYCGINTYGITTGVGLDRIDSAKGYSLQNVVTCCKVCNQIKNDHSLEFLRDHLKKMLITLEKLK